MATALAMNSWPCVLLVHSIALCRLGRKFYCFGFESFHPAYVPSSAVAHPFPSPAGSHNHPLQYNCQCRGLRTRGPISEHPPLLYHHQLHASCKFYQVQNPFGDSHSHFFLQGCCETWKNIMTTIGVFPVHALLERGGGKGKSEITRRLK